jgi:hypothetical protein
LAIIGAFRRLKRGESIGPVEHLQGVFEIDAVVARGSGIGDVDRHTVSSAGAPDTLLVVRGGRRNVAQKDGIQGPDVDAELEGGCADERVELGAVSLEQPLELLAVVGGDLGRVFLRANHVDAAREEHEVVVVLVLFFPSDRASAATCDAGHARRLAE